MRGVLAARSALPGSRPTWAGPGETDERHAAQASVGCVVCCVVPAAGNPFSP